MILSIKKFDHVTEISGADAILYDIGTDVAYFRDGQATGPSLVWTWSDEAVEGALLSHSLALSGDTPWIVRCDRVDFPPGSVAYRHIHPGHIRCTLFGGLTIDADGHKQRYGAFQPWFEVGPLRSKRQPIQTARQLSRALCSCQRSGKTNAQFST